jgi:glycerophosphoryl diester phosphodiesterase
VDESVVREFRRQGLAVFCWTKNDPADLARLVRLPLSGIVSDYPERIQEALRGAAKES